MSASINSTFPVISRELLKFLVSGSLNTALTYLLYYLLLSFLNYQLAYAITYIAGILISYWLNLKYVFQEVGNWKKFILYPGIYIIQYLVGALFLWLLVHKFSFSVTVAPIIVIILTLPMSFLLNRLVLTSKSRR